MERGATFLFTLPIAKNFSFCCLNDKGNGSVSKWDLLSKLVLET